MNCLNRANISTCPAIGTQIRIYLIDVAFRNSFNRTFINTGSACSAIFIDNVSHVFYFLVLNNYNNAAKLPKIYKLYNYYHLV
jgi:hypothetical protein